MITSVSAQTDVVLSKQLVVDACIAKAAGSRPDEEFLMLDEVTALSPKNCRDILQAIERLGYRVVMTPEIKKEWDSHQMGFALRWLSAMTRQSKIEMISSPHNDILRDKLISLIGKQIGKYRVTKETYAKMLKDWHLLEAALVTDKVILTLDKVRFHYKAISAQFNEIRTITWVNPDGLEEEAVSWLEAGARPDAHRMLGS